MATGTAKKWFATLENGKSYFCGEKLFTHGKPEIVSQEVKDYLEINAVHTLTVSQGSNKKALVQQKFTFKEFVSPDKNPEIVVDKVPKNYDLSEEEIAKRREDQRRKKLLATAELGKTE